MDMEFNLPKDFLSIIKVIGVGGGGSNAVNYMYNLGIRGVDFIVCNTDKQALDISPVPLKVQFGTDLTEGRGAGSSPEVGMQAAEESINEIKEILSEKTKMVFVTAGMGGGTGTGGAPVVAKIAKEMGILTVGIVTVPFSFEGRRRRQQAEEGIERIRPYVDTLLVINNEKLREISKNLTVTEAFSKADSVLSTAAKSIADVISVTGSINVDFNDVKTVMKDSGVAIMGSGMAEGENRAIECVEKALQSPLLNDNDIEGANYVLLNITYGDNELGMDEISTITEYVQDQAGNSAEVIFGYGKDESLGKQLSVTLIATGFSKNPFTDLEKAPEKTTRVLEVEEKNAQTPKVENTYVSPKEIEKKEVEMYIKPIENTIQTSSDKLTFEQAQAIENERQQKDASSSLSEVKKVENEFIFEFDTNPSDRQDEVTRYSLDGEVAEEMPVSEHKNEVADTTHTPIDPADAKRISEERIERIRQYTSSIRNADGLNKFENEPAFIRKKLDLDEVKYSEEERSRYSIHPDSNSNGRLNNNNSFLHDNVD